MTEFTQDDAFDLLEALKPHFPMIAGGFARGTGGIMKKYILEVIRETTPPSELIPTLINEVVEEAQQACRYHGKRSHPRDDDGFGDGFLSACERLGTTSIIADHVVRHEGRILSSVGYKKSDRGYIATGKIVDAIKIARKLRLAIVEALKCEAVVGSQYVGIVGLIYRNVVKYKGGNPEEILRKALADCNVNIHTEPTSPVPQHLVNL